MEKKVWNVQTQYVVHKVNNWRQIYSAQGIMCKKHLNHLTLGWTLKYLPTSKEKTSAFQLVSQGNQTPLNVNHCLSPAEISFFITVCMCVCMKAGQRVVTLLVEWTLTTLNYTICLLCWELKCSLPAGYTLKIPRLKIPRLKIPRFLLTHWKSPRGALKIPQKYEYSKCSRKW